ncbi:hypothetical protein, partial [Halobacillus sp. H74]|uniref:hypothetical protein n=1 Tax=Halobacillus sp. H74 TaxID=3457436 RepID=UPI003FCED611
KEKEYQAGYQALATTKSGLHHPTSEFEKIKNLKKTTKPPKEYGVKKTDDGEKRYQLFYICEESDCGHKGKRYVPKGSVYTNCHECGSRMNVRFATEHGFGYQDEYNNYYIAGSFQRNFNATKTLAGTNWN